MLGLWGGWREPSGLARSLHQQEGGHTLLAETGGRRRFAVFAPVAAVTVVPIPPDRPFVPAGAVITGRTIFPARPIFANRAIFTARAVFPA